MERFDDDWYRTSIMASPLGCWAIFSVIKSRAIMIKLNEHSYILDPSSDLLDELYKHIK